MIYYPTAGSLWMADLVQAALANSEVHLYKSSFAPNVNTTLAELVAAEADFSGYALEAMPTWNDPYLSPGGGAAINSELVQFATDDPTLVPNTIGGAWIQDSLGVLVVIIEFPTPVPMEVPFQAIPLSEILTFVSGL